ncbi:PREDICTED: uncharacterized protein LOC105122939 [Populus euphratica]|uniref:Uncharacterized protein LOC105122939 n=1 Tax=Populus euphratica TaxID=75702 RepID=A0AAJ6XJA7_POPEU|nr:PREDICTED: uncharacterized protein LOC105122939 [Populus euphratica]
MPLNIAESYDVLEKKTMFRARQTLARIKLTLQSKQFCSSTTKPNNNKSKSISEKTDSKVSKYEEANRQLDNLDFMKAAKILFSDPPKKKKFGIDFHLVQLFFTCLPSLAVYLVAQYARHEMKKMDAELEKKKKEEEEKAKEEELKAIEEKAQSESELLEVKERLGKLEEVVKEIAVESKKQSGGSVTKTQVQEDSSVTVKQKSLGPASIPNSSPQDQKGETQNEGTSPDAKR